MWMKTGKSVDMQIFASNDPWTSGLPFTAITVGGWCMRFISRPATATLGVDLPHCPLRPLYGSCHQRFRSRTRPGIEQVFRGLNVPCDQDSSDDSDDTPAAFVHERQRIVFAFCSPLTTVVKLQNLRLSYANESTVVKPTKPVLTA
jgi:hypothetical protein